VMILRIRWGQHEGDQKERVFVTTLLHLDGNLINNHQPSKIFIVFSDKIYTCYDPRVAGHKKEKRYASSSRSG
jgi:hypothetical protein